MDRRSTRLLVGVALIVVGTATVFVLGSVGGMWLPLLGLFAVALLTAGTLLAGTSGDTDSGRPV